VADPGPLELQAHAITTAMEAAHKVIVEDFWQRDGRAWLKYYHPGDGRMWTLTITPWPVDADPQPAIEWGVRFGTGSSRSEVGCASEAEARSGAAEIRAEKPGWNAVVIWRTAARPAGPWTDEEASDGR
jgi:hypothetical protein